MPSKIGYKFERAFISLTRKLLGKDEGPVLVETENGKFLVDIYDRAVGRDLRKKGRYGLDEIARLKNYINKESRILVVGAHIGALSIPLAKSCRELIAFEANPNTYELLTRNIELNNLQNLHTYNLAAGEKAEEIKFLLSRANSGGSKRVPKVKLFKYYYDSPEEVTVKSVSLDEFLEDKRFDLILMDIEGSEYFALKGMPKILEQSRVIVVEFEPHHLKNVSGVTVEQFVSTISPYFSKLTIPSENKSVERGEFVKILDDMYNKGQGDRGIIFEK